MNVCYVASVLAYLIDHTFVPLDNIQMTNIYLNLPLVSCHKSIIHIINRSESECLKTIERGGGR